MPLIKYIGHKDRKEDNVAGSGVVWEGNGDIQPVTAKVAASLIKHPDVWELVEGQSAEANAQGQGLSGPGTGEGASSPDAAGKSKVPAAKKAAKVVTPPATGENQPPAGGEGTGGQPGTGEGASSPDA